MKVNFKNLYHFKTKMSCCRSCADAAENGHLNCLIYLHQNGSARSEQIEDVPSSFWDERTPAYAAYNGHLDCLIYAHQNGCPWDEHTPAFASETECLKYAYIHGCPIKWEEKEVAKRLIQKDQEKIKTALKNTIQKEYNICTDVIDEIIKRTYLRDKLIQ